MDDGMAVRATALTKAYGRHTVLAGVDIAVPAGSIFALLGPNGAGKTTTVRILATLLRPDAGQARVAGYDVVRQRRQVRRAISLTGQHAAIDTLQTGTENLTMLGRLAGLSRADARRRAAELLERFDLVDAGRRRVATYSGGMLRRLDLAAGLVGSPTVIFLDEPTTGLDPRSRQDLWQVISELANGGATVLLTTQYLEEADQLADRIAVLDDGQVVAEGTSDELKRRVGGQRLDLTATDLAGFGQLLARLGDRAGPADADRLTLSVPTDGSAGHIRSLLDDIDPDRDTIARFTSHAASLDDVFLTLTGRPARADGHTDAGRADAGRTDAESEPANV
ncbi:ATP-binding cassette domain-containing protein [Micromonospora sp. NBC_01813]|uniref:ATP-binding cassette domain-containing protein n=1 Tax=Micromonospora sp. NBC_01813 TaxID=2975988 RepID=UPI002DDBD8D1|nr:ATP-binding cassette domain-containing protein [Micromonospora sp. NBC_01813]WSA07984.1 ATP-binding cassette domain-containing protein [Micromonospora sp. NBC_01813]